MKAIINKKIKLEELFENKGRCWEHTMDFLKQVKYKNDFDKYFEIIINLYGNNVEINYNGKLYCVDKSIFEIIEEPKTNFNIGDRVKNIKNMSKLDYCNKYIGLKGTIINIDDSDNVEPYFVKFDNGEKEWFKHNELELVEEPKEELEEIELIDIHYVNDKCIFKVNGKSIDETIAIKVNELIANQNKIIRELKDNKKQ